MSASSEFISHITDNLKEKIKGKNGKFSFQFRLKVLDVFTFRLPKQKMQTKTTSYREMGAKSLSSVH